MLKSLDIKPLKKKTLRGQSYLSDHGSHTQAGRLSSPTDGGIQPAAKTPPLWQEDLRHASVLMESVLWHDAIHKTVETKNESHPMI